MEDKTNNLTNVLVNNKSNVYHDKDKLIYANCDNIINIKSNNNPLDIYGNILQLNKHQKRIYNLIIEEYIKNNIDKVDNNYIIDKFIDKYDMDKMTARRAIKSLIDDNILIKDYNTLSIRKEFNLYKLLENKNDITHIIITLDK